MAGLERMGKGNFDMRKTAWMKGVGSCEGSIFCDICINMSDSSLLYW